MILKVFSSSSDPTQYVPFSNIDPLRKILEMYKNKKGDLLKIIWHPEGPKMRS